MAAVPAIVAFVAMWERSGYWRAVWGSIFAACFYVVWVMQSRGSTASIACALALVMVLLGGHARMAGWSVVAAVLLLFTAGMIPNDTVHSIYMFATRHTEGRELASMSGRTAIFARAWTRIAESPFIGYGPQADHRFFREIGNAQNGILYALLSGGFVGGACYVGGLLTGWLMLARELRLRNWMNPRDRMTLLQVAGIMTFFTLRNFPENSAALFGVDLLVQLPAIVLIGELDRVLVRMRNVAPARSAPSSAMSPGSARAAV